MTVLVNQIRAGAYADSIVLMQLQSDLQRLEGILEAGVVMGSAVNLEILAASELLGPDGKQARTDDLVVALRAESAKHADQALAQIETLMKTRRGGDSGDFRPRRLRSALRLEPEARWVSISVPGRWAGRVAHKALDSGCHVFLYSDNVPLEDEIELKSRAADLGRLVLGPDCGSAIIGGIGFGFTNVVRSGSIGLVCASGTGLQAISSRIHQLGLGVSQAIGTGGRDLGHEVRGATARQALNLLARDPQTEVIVLASKPPDTAAGARILAQALDFDKPVVVYFTGAASPTRTLGNLFFAHSLTEAAELAKKLTGDSHEQEPAASMQESDGEFLRGLFAGGTLALEAVQSSRALLSPLQSNLSVAGIESPADPTVSTGHCILDLGADEYTVGRLHPMMDPRLRLERLEQEAADPKTGVLLLDVVLGRGADPEPAVPLADILRDIRASRHLPIVVLVVGTDEDPQGLDSTLESLTNAGAEVYTEVSAGLARAIRLATPTISPLPNPVSLEALAQPTAAINIGLESLHEDLIEQGLQSVQLDWRPPAGGNEKLLAILERMNT